MFATLSPASVVRSIFQRMQQSPVQAAASAVASSTNVESDPRVAFEVVNDDGQTLQALFPTRTRQYRLEPEAIVYLQVFRDFGKAMRYVELHGKLRAEFGVRFNLWSVSIDGRRDDDLINEAVCNARDLMHALRNPVEVQEIEEFTPPMSSVPQPVDTPAAPIRQERPASPSQSRPPVAELIREGRFVFAGPRNWRGAEGQIGRPSFAAVIQRLSDGKEEALYGSDLSRAISDSGVKPGDLVRLMKFPRTPVQVGNRTVQKNIWTCDILPEASDARAASSHE